jgi:hypothetical protein
VSGYANLNESAGLSTTDEHKSPLAKATAGTSLAIWFCVILLGRLLPAFEGSTSFFSG